MTTAVRIAKQDRAWERLTYGLDKTIGLTTDVLSTAKDIGVTTISALAASPAFQVIGSCVAIEYIQMQTMWKGKTYQAIVNVDAMGNEVPPLTPGSYHALKEFKIKEPIISQALATSMETAIIAGIAVGGLSNGGIADIIKALLGKK